MYPFSGPSREDRASNGSRGRPGGHARPEDPAGRVPRRAGAPPAGGGVVVPTLQRRWPRILLLAAVTPAGACSEESTWTDEMWAIPDAALERCVRDALDLPEGDLGEDDVADLEHLTCPDRGIETLDGLEALVGLRSLSLWENAITDIGPLTGLVDLEQVQLGNNRIADAGPLADLVGLDRLGLALNAIEDSTPLSGLVGLTWLNLDHNALDDDDVEALCDLTALRWLTIEYNALWDEGSLDCFGFDDVYSRFQETARATAGRDLPKTAGGIPWSTRAPGFAGANERGPAYGGPAALRRPRLAPPDPVPGPRVPGERNTDLVDFAFASPNQFDAGSCLFMATSGAMEILLNQHTPAKARQYLGDTDLSERFLMNAFDHVDLDALDSDQYLFETDLSYVYGLFGGSLLSRDYPFGASYIRDTLYGYRVSDPSDPEAYFSCLYSWIDELPEGWEESLTPTPRSERTVIALDPDLGSRSRWNVGVMDRDVIERIKFELDTKGAPVVVMYDHFLHWHANVIVGYDDAIETGGCEFVEESIAYFEQQGRQDYADAIRQHMDEQGGCLDHGVFYVRDSIYEGTEEEPMYTYSEEYGYEDRYAARIVALSYDWVVYLANHVYSLHRRP